jgi:integrase
VSYGQGRVYMRGRVWWIQYDRDGKRHRESSGSKDREAALKLLRDRQSDAGRGVRMDLTLEDLVRMVREDYAINDRKTVAPFAQLLEYFKAKARVADLTTAAMTRYVQRRRGAGAAPQTVRNELAALGRGLTLAYHAGYLPSRPHLPSIQVRNTRSGFFEDGELEVVLAHLPEHLRGVVEFAAMTGWRRAEILGLCWRQVDFKAGTIRLEPGTTKNNEGRTFPFRVFPRLAALLEERRRQAAAFQRSSGRVCPWVFHVEGRQMRGWYYDAWRTACRKAGLPGKLVHDFRRTVVRNLERAGVPRSVAMKLTGHKTESVYRRYAIVSESDLAEGVAKLARLYGKAPAPAAAVGERHTKGHSIRFRPTEMHSGVASPTGFEPVSPP